MTLTLGHLVPALIGMGITILLLAVYFLGRLGGMRAMFQRFREDLDIRNKFTDERMMMGDAAHRRDLIHEEQLRQRLEEENRHLRNQTGMIPALEPEGRASDDSDDLDLLRSDPDDLDVLRRFDVKSTDHLPASARPMCVFCKLLLQGIYFSCCECDAPMHQSCVYENDGCCGRYGCPQTEDTDS